MDLTFLGTTELPLPQLMARLKGADWAERFHAALSLGKLGKGAKVAVPALTVPSETSRGPPERLLDSGRMTMSRGSVGKIGASGGPDARKVPVHRSGPLSGQET